MTESRQNVSANSNQIPWVVILFAVGLILSIGFLWRRAFLGETAYFVEEFEISAAEQHLYESI